MKNLRHSLWIQAVRDLEQCQRNSSHMCQAESIELLSNQKFFLKHSVEFIVLLTESLFYLLTRRCKHLVFHYLIFQGWRRRSSKCLESRPYMFTITKWFLQSFIHPYRTSKMNRICVKKKEQKQEHMQHTHESWYDMMIIYASCMPKLSFHVA